MREVSNVKPTLPVTVKGVSRQVTRLILRRWVCIEIVLYELVSNNPIEGTGCHGIMDADRASHKVGRILQEYTM